MATEGGRRGQSALDITQSEPLMALVGKPRLLDKFGAESSRALAQPQSCVPLPRKGVALWAGSLRWNCTLGQHKQFSLRGAFSLLSGLR